MPFAAGKGFSGLAAILSGIRLGMWGNGRRVPLSIEDWQRR
jgi:hypothetical protein